MFGGEGHRPFGKIKSGHPNGRWRLSSAAASPQAAGPQVTLGWEARHPSGTYAPSGEGKFFFTMMAAFAELERDIIHERTMAGLAAARARAATAAARP